MTSAVALAEPRGVGRARERARDERIRWRMTIEARALLLVTGVLLAFGLAVLYSSSALAALNEGRASVHYLVRQLAGVVLGAVTFALAAKIDAERWRRWAWPLMGLSIVALSVIILPGTEAIAPRINGSRRWLQLGMTLQPSELAKLAVVAWTAMLIVKKGDQLRRLTKGLLPFLVMLGVLDLLVLLEPDLSMAMMFTLLMGIVLFAGGARVGHFVVLGVLAIPILWREMERAQYALLRLTAFLDPGSAPLEAHYQLRQSLIAVGSGQLIGQGFGEGRQQLGFLPYPFNDFIGSNVGEEWGFLGMLFIVGAFTLYAFLGLRIARDARTRFQQVLAVGLTATTVVTAYLHIGVVIGLLPTTGLTLPFFSYGRSNLIVSLLCTGILVNIGSRPERVVGASATDPVSLAAT